MSSEERNPPRPKVVVIVLNWNNWQDTIACAESVLRGGYPNRQLVVVDNASTDGSMERLEDWAEGRFAPPAEPDDPLRHLSLPGVKKPISHVEYDRSRAERAEEATPDVPLVFIQTGENLGYAGGNNVALRYARRSDPRAYALVLGNDVVVTPEFIGSAMDCVSSGPAAGASVLGFAARRYYEPDRLWVAYISEQFTRGPVKITAPPEAGESVVRGVMVYGGAMLISPDAPVGLFPEEYFLYYEETDFCKQILRKGGDVAVQLDNPVYERGARSVGIHSPLQLYYSRRNKLAYSKKNHSTLEYTIILTRMAYSSLIGCLRTTLRGERTKAKAYALSLTHHLRGKMGRTWKQD